MPNINLTDSRKRDAVVKAENTGVDEEVRYVDGEGNTAYTRKILKATVEHDYDTLIKRYDDDPEKLALALADADPEVDMEKCGVFLWGVSKVYVNSDDGIVYRIEQTEIVRDPFGEVKEERPRRRTEANVDADIPLTWTGRQIDKAEAARRFVFSSKLQIVHVNGLTYDFLFGMASELALNNTLMMVGGGGKGRDPLIFRSGSIPYRGFLEGRVNGDKYVLLLHLSNMELKLPAQKPSAIATDEKGDTKQATGADSQSKDTPAKHAVDSASDQADNSVAPPATKTPAKSKKSKSKKTAATKKKAATDKSQGEKSNEENTPQTNKAKKNKKAGKGASATKNKKDKVIDKPFVDADAGKERITSEDLGVWLKSIRMGKYLSLFVENEIDVDVLPDLSDDDLKELDIPVGSRRRLLKAVAETADLRAEVALSVRKMAKTAGNKN